MVTGDQYCDCSSGGDKPLSCPEGEVFCDLIGDCIHVFEVWVYILYAYKSNRLKLDLNLTWISSLTIFTHALRITVPRQSSAVTR